MNIEQMNEITINSYIEKINLYAEEVVTLIRKYDDEDFLSEDFLTENGSRVAIAKNTISKVKRANKVASDKVDTVFDRLIKDTRKAIIGQSREEIINNRIKVSTIIKKAILTGTSFYINPALGLLTTFVQLCVRGRLKIREKNRILADLKAELEICEEKIRDAEADNDRKKKYELMRVRREIQRSIEKIRYAAIIKE